SLSVYLSRRTIEPSPEPMNIVPFTSFPGEEYMPCFSPDGNLIAFNWNGEKGGREEDSSIYVKQIGSEKALRLTFDSTNDWGPVWSPDGQRIAFNRFTQTEACIFMVPALGGPARKLLTLGPVMGLGGLASLDWSPDGKFIAFTYKDPKDGPAKISLVSPDTLAIQNLTTPPANTGDFNPAFSPDSQSVAFVRQRFDGADIYEAPISGAEPKRLTFDNAFLTGLTWSPDGRDIVFSSNRGGGEQALWRISASGGSAGRVGSNTLNFWFPNAARKGNRLTCAKVNPDDANIYRVEVSGAAGSRNPP